jgi:23S rRNA-/tRNA-specific pseudouridylate synthase
LAESNISRAIRVDATLAGQRIDKAAAVLLPEFSRTQLVEWVRDGSLTLDGRMVPAKQRVFGGEALVLNHRAVAPRWDARNRYRSGRVFERRAAGRRNRRHRRTPRRG